MKQRKTWLFNASWATCVLVAESALATPITSSTLAPLAAAAAQAGAAVAQVLMALLSLLAAAVASIPARLGTRAQRATAPQEPIPMWLVTRAPSGRAQSTTQAFPDLTRRRKATHPAVVVRVAASCVRPRTPTDRSAG